MSDTFWLSKCFWCHNGFNGQIREHDRRTFHLVCLSDYVAFVKGIKAESDKEVKRNIERRVVDGALVTG
ncbi:MAG: hypothetical protein A2734_00770 [Parcubacteria group bacterium RIFCSPHIGHO2_01_FULL_40_30]|nr:MAG: hypothetical protein A2734_00770 [Parcubacteria group bacterium RIFCSPHIGHO2_01_FULL_40_30]OHB23684.1 MAG: hypothetical protein A3I22_02525 [Parcubacteria group bacterium RIFCSPLOWO2_02_FULL_40_12]OHB24381.1 MAG: hypothetical protein A3F96_00715 [Parcubacteria group bacterium RIFCSPLOWO2_12_FULL_40_10]